MRAHDDQLTFRDWLVKQLTITRWSAPAGATTAELAVHLGVQVDVLLEAQALRSAELKKRGQGGISKGRRRYIGSDYAEIEVVMPRSIHEEWTAFCRARQIEPGTVFRSLIHHFLLAPARPSNTGSRWLRNGVIVPIPWPRKKALRARTRITRGAQVAFDTHADEWNVPPMALARGILGDFLEGKIPRVKMVAFSELWGDADRYLHPEKFR